MATGRSDHNKDDGDQERGQRIIAQVFLSVEIPVYSFLAQMSVQTWKRLLFSLECMEYLRIPVMTHLN